MSTLTFIVEQAPQAMGYALYAVTLGEVDGKPTMNKEVIAFKSSLVEISMVRGQMEKDAFGAEALPPREVHYVERPRLQQPQAQPHQEFENGAYPHVPLGDRPQVLDKMEFPQPDSGQPSTYEKIKGAIDKRRANGIATFAIGALLTLSYLGSRLA
jgi:hypothetical protein